MRDVEKIGTPEPGSGASPTQNISEKSGEGYIFLNFTQARLFRVIDRLRAIGRDLANAADGERDDLLWARRKQLRRATILRNAILFGTLVIAFTVLTALLLLVSDLAPSIDARWPIVTFALGLVAFAVALALVVWDAFLSVALAREPTREFHEGMRR